MGSPLSPMVANLVMEELEEWALSRLTFVVPFYKRYVDDILVAVPRDGTDEICNTFNGFHERLKFTHEKETNRRINFLDVTLSSDMTTIK